MWVHSVLKKRAICSPDSLGGCLFPQHSFGGLIYTFLIPQMYPLCLRFLSFISLFGVSSAFLQVLLKKGKSESNYILMVHFFVSFSVQFYLFLQAKVDKKSHYYVPLQCANYFPKSVSVLSQCMPTLVSWFEL